jgi:hypothetical protein
MRVAGELKSKKTPVHQLVHRRFWGLPYISVVAGNKNPLKLLNSRGLNEVNLTCCGPDGK